MHWTARQIRRYSVVSIGLCAAVTILLFARTNRSKLKHSFKDLLGPTAGHLVENNSPKQTPKYNQSGPGDASFMKHQAWVQHQRLQQLRRACAVKAEVSIAPFDLLPKHDLANIIVNDKYRLLYCPIPKVASTSWIRVFLVLNGVLRNTRDGEQTFVHRGALRSLRMLDSYDDRETRAILDTYTKVVFVRNPFSRILSAFRNKLDASVSHRQNRLWHNWINQIHSYDGNRTFVDERPARARGNNITFGQFVRFVNDPRNGNNKHWESMMRLCLPCHINYTFVGKLETIRNDADYLLRHAKIDKLVSFPSSLGSSPTNSSAAQILASYFADVPDSDIQRMRVRFKWDFALFGYHSVNDEFR